MARQPRLDLAGVAQHIVQRGNDPQACFADDADYLHYRQELGEAAMKYGCDVSDPFFSALSGPANRARGAVPRSGNIWAC